MLFHQIRGMVQGLVKGTDTRPYVFSLCQFSFFALVNMHLNKNQQAQLITLAPLASVWGHWSDELPHTTVVAAQLAVSQQHYSKVVQSKREAKKNAKWGAKTNVTN